MKKITAAVLLALASLAHAEEMALAVSVKGINAPAVDLMILEKNGRYYIEPAAIEALGLREIKGWREVQIEHMPWLDISSIGFIVINKTTLTASLELPVDQLPLQKIEARRLITATPKAEAGAFANYRLGYINGGSSSPAFFTGMFEAHKTTAGGWDFGGSFGITSQPGAGLVVGELNAVHRDPEARKTTTFGSGYSTAGAWGASGRFIGAQVKTDNSLNPGYITTPGLSFNGMATAPSTAQLFINGQQFGANELNAGPFQLNNVTMPYTAGGDVVAQVKGIDGQTTTITGKLIGAPFNLKAGDQSYSFEAGALRKGSQLEVGNLFAAGTYAKGFSDTLTIEGHAELGRKSRAGVNATLATPYGTLTGGIAAGTAGQGMLSKFGYVLSGKDGSLSFSHTNAAKFVNFDDLPTRSLTALSANYRLTKELSVSGNYAKYDGGSRAAVLMSYNFAPAASISVSVDQSKFDDQAQDSKGFFAFLNVSFGGKYSSSTTYRSEKRANGQTSGYATENLQMARQEYTGTRASASASSYRNGYKAQRADISYAGLNGEIQAVASTDGKNTSGQVFLTGSVVKADNGLHLARQIDDSYAIVKVENGQEGIPLTHWNSAVAKTDKDGVAVIARTHAFQKNAYDFSTADMPDAILATVGAEGTPYRHAPALIAIKAKRPGFFIEISGAISAAVDIDSKRGFRMSDGSYYVEDVRDGKHTGRAGDCEFEINVDLDGSTEMPTLKAVCKKQIN